MGFYNETLSLCRVAAKSLKASLAHGDYVTRPTRPPDKLDAVGSLSFATGRGDRVPRAGAFRVRVVRSFVRQRVRLHHPELLLRPVLRRRVRSSRLARLLRVRPPARAEVPDRGQHARGPSADAGPCGRPELVSALHDVREPHDLVGRSHPVPLHRGAGVRRAVRLRSPGQGSSRRHDRRAPLDDQSALSAPRAPGDVGYPGRDVPALRAGAGAVCHAADLVRPVADDELRAGRSRGSGRRAVHPLQVQRVSRAHGRRRLGGVRPDRTEAPPLAEVRHRRRRRPDGGHGLDDVRRPESRADGQARGASQSRVHHRSERRSSGTVRPHGQDSPRDVERSEEEFPPQRPDDGGRPAQGVRRPGIRPVRSVRAGGIELSDSLSIPAGLGCPPLVAAHPDWLARIGPDGSRTAPGGEAADCHRTPDLGRRGLGRGRLLSADGLGPLPAPDPGPERIAGGRRGLGPLGSDWGLGQGRLESGLSPGVRGLRDPAGELCLLLAFPRLEHGQPADADLRDGRPRHGQDHGPGPADRRQGPIPGGVLFRQAARLSPAGGDPLCVRQVGVRHAGSSTRLGTDRLLARGLLDRAGDIGHPDRLDRRAPGRPGARPGLFSEGRGPGWPVLRPFDSGLRLCHPGLRAPGLGVRALRAPSS